MHPKRGTRLGRRCLCVQCSGSWERVSATTCLGTCFPMGWSSVFQDGVGDLTEVTGWNLLQHDSIPRWAFPRHAALTDGIQVLPLFEAEESTGHPSIRVP
ncbi:PREDICTED: uncharacterized protein LOC102019674 isoform X4 [Chinchilla lanigera]|uniref:uncharacterized protein LOC102019674 isoform X4 n=1 Tax=Chinchilla lanigera TaxID=34839 RepID=UPI000695BD5D|nr:PREDICTED: uncharacterized protein LOC102019674 isoform X4 [Chinchilla lanigera]